MLDMDETATSNQKETNVAEHVKDFKLMLKQVCIIRLYRGSYMSAHVLLNLLRVGEKRFNARLASHFISFSQRV